MTWSFADSTSRGYILNAWLAAWQSLTAGSPDPQALARCPCQDEALLAVLAPYVAGATSGAPLYLCMPTLSPYALRGTLATYENTGYTQQPFLDSGGNWLYGTFDDEGNLSSDPTVSAVALLLQMIFYGAQIVSISSSEDTSENIVLLRDVLEDTLSTRTDLVSSHYGNAGIGSGKYYTPSGAPVPSLSDPDIETLATSSPPGNEPLLFAALAGVTATTKANGFLQAEGWPAQLVFDPPGGSRHDGDFQTNTDLLWNVSTFGACAYSEKRSTPIFLAPSDFDLTLHADTGMPYYWGANQGNVGASWMHANLVVIPRVLRSRPGAPQSSTSTSS